MDETNLNNPDTEVTPRHFHWYIYTLALLVLAAAGYFLWQKRGAEAPRSDAPQHSLPLVNGKIPEDQLGEPLESEQQKVTDFGNKPPEGLPDGLPIDPEPTRVHLSYVAISPNPPPEDGKQITYAYFTKRSTLEIYDSFKNYLVKNNFTIENEELKGQSGAIYARKPDDPDYSFGLSIARESETENIVTISILTK